MSPFEQAIAEEEKWLCNIVDRPMPTDDRAGHRVYIGPTRIDMSAVHAMEQAKPGQPERPRIPPDEQANLKKWRSASLRYLHGHRAPRHVDPAHPNRSF